MYTTLVSIIFSLLTNTSHVHKHHQQPEYIEVKPAHQYESNEHQTARYEKTMELLANARSALKDKEFEKAVTLVTEAKRLSGYLGGVKELYAETLAAYLEDTKKLSDCIQINKRLNYVKENIPEVSELYEKNVTQCI